MAIPKEYLACLGYFLSFRKEINKNAPTKMRHGNKPLLFDEIFNIHQPDSWFKQEISITNVST